MVESNEKQIFIGNDNEVIELTGADKEAFIAERQATANKVAIQKADAEAKATAKAALLKKLGITAEEAVLLLS
jgi:hypothetical protein